MTIRRSHTLVRVSGPTTIATRRPSEGSHEWWAQVLPLSIRLHSPHTNYRYAYRSLRKLFTGIHCTRLLILGTSELETPFGSPKVASTPHTTVSTDEHILNLDKVRTEHPFVPCHSLGHRRPTSASATTMLANVDNVSVPGRAITRRGLFFVHSSVYYRKFTDISSGQTAIIDAADELDEGYKITSAQIPREVCGVTNILKAGNQEGRHRPRLHAYDLARCCHFPGLAWIGAILSVDFAGFSSKPLRDRTKDCESRVLVASDEGQ